MQRMCDICGERVAELFDRIVMDNKSIEYCYCKQCYQSLLKQGITPSHEAQSRIARRGLECPHCKTKVEEFEKTFLLGCRHCYTNMRDVVLDKTFAVQGLTRLSNKHTYSMRDTNVKSIMADCDNKDDHTTMKCAKDCTLFDLVRHNVISSRIRLARNIDGLNFPRKITLTDDRIVNLINGCFEASKDIFNGRILPMSSLSKLEKMALVERHIISLPLANNTQNGAVIVERDSKYGGMSVMINEEDHIREQCINDGFDLVGAYKKICAFDNKLVSTLPTSYDEQLGFLTACPTNVGTGMRASVMLFLPALRRAGAIDDALKTFKSQFGLTIRGVFGEGSDAAYDMYQISNSRTLGVSESETIEQVEQAVVRMCYCERVALEQLVEKNHTQLFDGILRSYGVLKNAYTLTSQELMKLLVDVKLGVILGILPIKDIRILDEMIWACTPSSLEIITGKNSLCERDRMRVSIVRELLAEEK